MADRWRDEDRNRWARGADRYEDDGRGYRHPRHDEARYESRHEGGGVFGTRYGDYSRRGYDPDREMRHRPYEEPGYLGGFGRASHYDRGIVGGERGRIESADDYDRMNRDRNRDRGWVERAGDEVASWFGDEEAERRREMDDRRDDYRDRYARDYRLRDRPRGRWHDDW